MVMVIFQQKEKQRQKMAQVNEKIGDGVGVSSFKKIENDETHSKKKLFCDRYKIAGKLDRFFKIFILLLKKHDL